MQVVKKLIVIGILIAIAYLASNYYVENKDKDLKKDMIDRIDKVFGGKTTISDGEIFSVNMRQKNVPSGNFYKEYEDLVSYYECLSGGFNIVKAIRNPKRDIEIDIREIYSTNMGYKVRNVSYWDNLPSFNDAYKMAYDYLTIEDKSSGFTKGMYSQITRLDEISNEYYSLENSHGGEYKLSGEQFVYNYYNKVFYTYKGNEYYLRLNHSIKKREFWKIFGFSTFGIILLSFVFLYKPQPKRIQDKIEN
jgi:hypothetical protein